MKVLHLAIVGFGKLGRACIQAIREDEQSTLAGIVRQSEHVAQQLPTGFEGIQVAGHITELEHVDAALICVPNEAVLGSAHDLLQAGIPVVECNISQIPIATGSCRDFVLDKSILSH